MEYPSDFPVLYLHIHLMSGKDHTPLTVLTNALPRTAGNADKKFCAIG